MIAGQEDHTPSLEGTRSQLLAMYERDQEYRRRRDRLLAEPPSTSRTRELSLCRRHIIALARKHERWLHAFVSRCGWPACDQYGDEAATAAFALVLHVPSLTFQKYCLERIELSARRGRTDPFHFAFLWDRIAITEGRKQRFGTQIADLPGGQFALWPIEDARAADAWRRKKGILSIAEQFAAKIRFEQRLVQSTRATGESSRPLSRSCGSRSGRSRTSRS